MKGGFAMSECTRLIILSVDELDYRDPSDKEVAVAQTPERPNLENRTLSLRHNICILPSGNEDAIATYLEKAPVFSAMGRVVGDVLDPSAKVALFPGLKTDGLYVWPTELSYYVRKYHIRMPADFIERMASFNWQPPDQKELDWDGIYGMKTDE